MRTRAQLDHDLYRVLLYRRDAAELLFASTADGLELPAVPVPRFTRVAEKLTAGIKDRWNLDTCCLFPVLEGISSSVRVPFHVVELSSREPETPAAMRWLAATSLSAADFRDHDDFVAVRASLVRLEGFRRGELPGAFGKPGWLESVTEWVAARAATARLSLTGKFGQLNASPTFSLVRFETNGPAVWFKAVGEPNEQEFLVAQKLASRFPEFVPRIIGARDDCRAWLSVEAEGRHPNENTSAEIWARIGKTLGLLEIASMGCGLHFIDAGAKDLRLCNLRSLVTPFLEVMGVLMDRQPGTLPRPLSRPELRHLGDQIEQGLSEFEDLAVPNVLVHGDFNPGNIIASQTACVFLDWAEAAVGSCFITLQYLREHIRKFKSRSDAAESAAIAAYAEVWSRYLDPDAIARAISMAPFVAVTAYTLEMCQRRAEKEMFPEPMAGFLRSLTRRMKLEADLFAQRNVLCL